MTFSEVLVWNELKNGKMMGYDFDRQRPIGNYIVDFYCKDIALVLEIDGITHEDEQVKANDLIRQRELESFNVSVLRFNALLAINKIEAVVREIRDWILSYEEMNGVNENVLRRRLKMENLAITHPNVLNAELSEIRLPKNRDKLSREGKKP